ncbi:MAG: YfhO family protein, partial [Eudoraea sp.]
IGLLGLILLFDLVGVDLRYVNKDDFVRQRRMSQPFAERPVDKEILKDQSIYRVYDPSEGLNGARTSYFHKSIGGYHAAKPAAIQDIFDYHIYRNNFQVLNMLNVKYLIQQDQEGKNTVLTNPEASGNAWFVEKIIQVNSADEEIASLDSLDVLNEAVVNTQVVSGLKDLNFERDSLASITLQEYNPNVLKYVSQNSNLGLAIFSEVYYPQDWNCYIDGKLTDHFKVNYLLRAVEVPPGEHEIVFKFEPEVVKTGAKISLASSILLMILLLGGGIYSFWRARSKEEG